MLGKVRRRLDEQGDVRFDDSQGTGSRVTLSPYQRRKSGADARSQAGEFQYKETIMQQNNMSDVKHYPCIPCRQG